MSQNKILFKLTGSIACFKAAALISKLVQNGFEVQTVTTRSALKFIGEATLEALTGKKVFKDTFASGELMGHINLAKWSDLTIVYPATANTLNKLANGIGDDLVSTLFLAHRFNKPYLLAPAMNTRMLEHPATQQSLKRLREYGVELLEPGAGALACGETGSGRLIEVEDAFAQIKKHLAVTSLSEKFGLENDFIKPKSVLVTSGGTREPIDGVRSITNMSTGETGSQLADHLAEVGHDVTLIRAEGSAVPKLPLTTLSFTTFDDLESVLKRELSSKSYDTVIHLAAVSDYSVASVEVDGEEKAPSAALKIPSSQELKIKLKRNHKIVDQLKSYSLNPAIKLISFKLTKNAEASQIVAKVEALVKNSSSDYVVHNDLTQISANAHFASIINRSGQKIASVSSKQELAESLEKIVREVQP